MSDFTDNITISEDASKPVVAQSYSLDEQGASSIYNQSLPNIEISDENVALNVMVSFLNLAQKRGAFGIDESAKIWECIQKFIKRQ